MRLDGVAVTLVFALERGGTADLVYLGTRLPESEDLTALAAAGKRGRHESQPDVPPVPGLLPERKGGWSGTPAIELRLAGKRLETDFRTADWSAADNRIEITFADDALEVDVFVTWRITASDVIEVERIIANASGQDLELARSAAVSLPIPQRFTEVTSFAGRWSGEMREERRTLAPEGFARKSSGGKPGFGGGNWLILHDPASGQVLGAHLAWSGDYHTTIDCDPAGTADGRAVLQMGTMKDAGYGLLPAASSTETPMAVLALAANGSALAQQLHTYLRAEILPVRAAWSPRKVHINSWEALGFGLSEPKLMALADSAAALGIERFVLDDGWFARRRNDRSSLGDWHVSPDIFPNGLGPLIAHVHALGMDFGLWVEPEMVSPESDLYRAHPDWCLHNVGRERPTMRGQLALDMSRGEVRDYLFDRLDALLRENPIAYLKWDHNRDLFPSVTGQTEGFYALLDALRAANPTVEIESCSSGGGRIDYGVLSRVHRVWPSDNNDPIERLRIMRAWSHLLPLEVLGNHVGPSPNPITGRATSMDFRAKVALFGHMGVEADPGAMSEHERSVLATHIALYKDWRGVLHTGRWFALDHPDPGIFAQMAMHDDKALAVAAQTAFSPVFDAVPLRLKGLEDEARYRVTLPRPWPGKASLYLNDWQAWESGLTLSGRALMSQGLALPLTHPETAWLVALERLPQ
ncbi:alpha-galactosidase [Erythrobacter sp. sf7]|uniref:alpha-galactosidase n=1 Tax=Erythrobacter fulvus TaxID=2987523 RepID=A0ABT5JRM9_9SPHN|nr:alpha-galactosidase [Erythrobacter fulvus]MDC8755313.1 alpha-galactosidase [Erythrobacter fulvus]